MTKLEADLLHVIEVGRHNYGNATGGSEDLFIMEAVREVAMQYIQKAYEDAFMKSAEYRTGSHARYSHKNRVDWLVENGVI